MTIAEAAPTSLSALLRDGSRAEHTAAEGSTFMSELLDGRIGVEGYVAYLGRLRRVYAALEGAAARFAADPVASRVVDPRLERLAAIDADLAHFGSDATAGGPSPAADAYVARLEGLTDGGSFVAHHYTRYLGDLSGGQAIGRILARTFDLDTAGVAFYAFDEVPRPKPFKDAYRATLDGLPLDAVQQHAVLDEVKVVFGLNGALFEELTAEMSRWTR